MRKPLDDKRLREVLEALGRACRGPGKVYVTGGATALLHGWRETTVDLDLKLDPEPDGAFEAIARLKQAHDVNIELASPDLFLPELSDWRAASVPIGRFGPIEVLHYDLRAQALAKLARGLDRDLRDVDAMLARGLVTCEALRSAFDSIRSRLIRFPRIDEHELQGRLEAACARSRPEEDGA